jgi:hypothetical protein
MGRKQTDAKDCFVLFCLFVCYLQLDIRMYYYEHDILQVWTRNQVLYSVSVEFKENLFWRQPRCFLLLFCIFDGDPIIGEPLEIA